MTIGKLQEKIPPDYVAPWKHVTMEERMDDSLACVAMLTGRSLAEIKEQAYKFGRPKFGPAWVYNQMVAKLLYQYGLIASDDKEVDDIASLPDVAILMLDFNKEMDFGRYVLWHQVRGTDEQPAFNYILDPANWLDEKYRITADFRHLKIGPPLYFIEVTPRPDTAMARKGK